MKHTRNLVALVLFAVLVLPAFSEGQKDKPMQLTLLYGGTSKWPDGYKDTEGYPDLETKLIAKFQNETGVLVNRKLVDLSTGSTMSMDALIAAGIPPDVYVDFAGRVSKYMNADFALDLKPYFKDLDDFFPSVLATATRNGKVLAVPQPSWGVAMVVNEDILDAAGYKWPAEWTIDEYLKAAELIKKNVPGKFAGILFSKNQSSDQQWMPWFYAFGARVYAPGDYSKTIINTPNGIATLKFFQTLVGNGYVPPNPEALDDDMALELWAQGKIAFMAMQVAHTQALKSAVQQGVGKEFKFHFVEFPHAKGEKPTPASAGPTLAVVHKTSDEARNRASARLAWWLTGAELQKVSAITQGSFPSRISAGKPLANDPLWMQLATVIEKNGVCDFGITTPTFSAVRAQMFPLLSEMYLGKLTPEQVLQQYEANVNKILSGK